MKNNISKIIMYVVIAISVVVLGAFFAMSGTDGKYGEVSGNYTEFNGLDLLLWWAYVLLLVSILTALVMSIINLGKNPGSAKQGLFGVIVLVAVLVVASLLAKTDSVAIAGGKVMYTDKAGLRIADIGLYTSYFALAAAFGVVIWGGIKNSLK